MTPRQIVYAALEFDSPPRTPRQLWFLPWAMGHYPKELEDIQKRFPPDIVNCPCFYTEPVEDHGDPWKKGEYTDEFGCVRVSIYDGIMGEIKKPLVQDWFQLDKVRIPTGRLSLDIEKANAFCRQTDEFVITRVCARPFERLQFIRGSENLYLDLGLRPPELTELLNRLHDFFMKEVEVWSRTEVDAVLLMDDWGAQQSLLISPAMWRDIFKPLYKDYADLIRSHGKKVFMHSDGYILDIYPDLIEIGIDAVNSQIFCMGLDKLSAFKGKITFWGEVDRQHILPEGSREDILEAVRNVRDSLWHNGGVIAQCEFGPGARPENVAAVFEAWQQLDRQPAV